MAGRSRHFASSGAGVFICKERLSGETVTRAVCGGHPPFQTDDPAVMHQYGVRYLTVPMRKV